MARPGLLLLILAALLGAAPAAAQSRLDAIRERLLPEFGPLDANPLAAHLLTAAVLPGQWVMMTWRTLDGFTDEHLATQCTRNRLVIAPDLTVRLESVRRNGPVSVPGRIVPWVGRVFSLNLEERAYLEDYIALPEAQRNGDAAFGIRRNANRMLSLSPRDPDLLVGYDMYGGEAMLFIRCPATTP